jgi:hypothetical protein
VAGAVVDVDRAARVCWQKVLKLLAAFSYPPEGEATSVLSIGCQSPLLSR